MPQEIQQKLIEEEMKESYIDYAMSVIVGRALPDIRDGLKPVHRRILYAMHEMGLQSNKPFRKCARIVGDVLGKYHPHGDTAVYDSLVRMAQNFSLRYPLVNGQGNFGSVDGDNAAAMRYTEAKLSKISDELLLDIEKDTVDFTPNFDNSLKEPSILPSKLPNLLVNGSSGIAVGMATNIPPHNLREICNAVVALIDNPELTINELINYVKGPDFPTGGQILGINGIKQYYLTGKGRVVVRAKTEFKDDKIMITEIPYQVNKTSLIEAIADLVKEKSIEGIRDIRDESDRKGMSIVLILNKNANADVVLNQLFKHSALQTTFGVIMLALKDNQPKILNLKQMLESYLDYRKEIILKRTKYDLDKAEKRIHILEGLLIALADIDNVVTLIKKSKSPLDAKNGLMKKYSLSEEQSQAILDMKLQRLTSLEQDKIKDEEKELNKFVKELKEILGSKQRVLEIIKDELKDLIEKYGDDRRTEILTDMEEDIETEDLIERSDVVVTATYTGYIKQVPLEEYKKQKRGGKGVTATTTKEEDVVEHLFVTSNHNYLLFFTNKGKVYWLKAYQLPEGSRYAKGKAIVNLLNLEEGERLSAILPISEFTDTNYLLFATKKGLLKKTSLKEYSNPRKGGIRAISLRDDDEVVKVRLTPGNLHFIIATKKGCAVKFDEKDVRDMGRGATGVRGIRLGKDDAVVGIEVALESGALLTVTENGFGKRTLISEYRLIKRGGKGVINIQTTPRNGNVVGIKTVRDGDEIILISKNGIIIRIEVTGVSLVGRNTQGVRLMRLNENDKVTTIARVIQNGD
ncbi:MAG: DNA gyrase subunit A [Candidatus Nanoarchaeia archaeon]|nr:DNA gyrase subunit A [Candidatus Nanoarchaeia archaeon]